MDPIRYSQYKQRRSSVLQCGQYLLLQLQQLAAQRLCPLSVPSSATRSLCGCDVQNEIDPYSNWRGPIWIVANVCLSYGLNAYVRAS